MTVNILAHPCFVKVNIALSKHERRDAPDFAATGAPPKMIPDT
jgi:hypothetical protein